MFLTVQCRCFHLLSQSCHVCRVSCVSQTNPPSILCRGFLCLDFSAPPTLYTVQVFLGFLVFLSPTHLYTVCVSGVYCVSQPSVYRVCCVSCISQPFIQSVFLGFLVFLVFLSPLYSLCIGVSCVSCVSQPHPPFIRSVFLGFLVFLVFLSPLYSLCIGVSCVSCVSQPHPPFIWSVFLGFLVFLVFLSPTHRLYGLGFWGFLCFLCFSAPPTVYTSGFLGFLVFLVFLSPTHRLYGLGFWGFLCFLCFLCFSAPPTVYTAYVSGVSCASCVSQPHPPCYATHENYVIDSDQSNELLETLLRDCSCVSRYFTEFRINKPATKSGEVVMAEAPTGKEPVPSTDREGKCGVHFRPALIESI